MAHPIQERQGMLFVWGEGGPTAQQESRRTPPPLCGLTEETLAAGEVLCAAVWRCVVLLCAAV